jgi:Uma2 family endonuclease
MDGMEKFSGGSTMGSPRLTLFETPKHVRMSAQQCIDSPYSECKSDLIEGVFVMASPASYEHELLVSFVIATLRNFVDAKQLGQVLSSNAAFRLSKDNVFQPDISFVAAECLHLASEVYFDGPPDIAVEIVSPSSRQYDLVEKNVNYGRFGVREYWLIDPIARQATFFTQAEGQLIPLDAAEGELRSRLLDGYWLRLEWLFPSRLDQRPGVLEVARLHGLLGTA